MIAYTPTTNLGLDYGWDGQALTDGNVAIYSLGGGSKLGIQARPAFDPVDEVPMEYKVSIAGSYSISLDHFDGVFLQGQQIYLRDNLLNVVHNLESPYGFITDAGTISGRFDVIYAEPLSTDDPVFDANSIIVYKQDTAINISTGNTDMKSVAIYDTRGRLLYISDNINAAQTSVTTLHTQEQMLIVQVTTVGGVKASRKIVF
ncbi:MAG: T9SS sorting signal type C domain-containing protein [Flavobacterium sp.]